MDEEPRYGVDNKEPLAQFRGHTPEPQFYGYCALCGEPINRAAKTQGRAPSVCSSPECKRERDRLKKQASRRGKRFEMQPLGGRGDLAWLADRGETVGQDGFQTHGRSGKPFSFNTQDHPMYSGYTAVNKVLGADYWAAEEEWKAIETERMLQIRHESLMSPKPPMGGRPYSKFLKQHEIDAIFASIREEQKLSENLSVIVAAVHKETNEIEDMVFPITGIKVNSADRITECVAKLSENNYVNVAAVAWKWLVVDDSWSDEFLLDLLTRWHGSIQAELDGVSYNGVLGSGLERIETGQT